MPKFTYKYDGDPDAEKFEYYAAVEEQARERAEVLGRLKSVRPQLVAIDDQPVTVERITVDSAD